MGLLNNYLKIALSCVTIYLFIIVFIRLFGKKELAQLSVTDLVFILLISNAVQNAMVGSDSTLVGGLIAAASLFVVNFLFKFVIYKFPQFGSLVQGSSLLLIYKGELHQKNLAKARITLQELEEAIREHGVMKIVEVDLAVLEVDGNISILSNEFKNKTSKKRKGRSRVMKTAN
jgi:uncharacterized membrane protein YcaP (DUF421 family)